MKTLVQLDKKNCLRCWRLARLVLTLTMMISLGVLQPLPVQAQNYTYKVLYTFAGNAAGSQPTGRLIKGAATTSADLYGVTAGGGNSCFWGWNGCGTLFKLNSRTGKHSVLYSFVGDVDGRFPNTLVRDSAGNLYGITEGGGDYYDGVIFKLDKTGDYSVLYQFCSQPECADGRIPGLMIRDSMGNLYGTTGNGGANNGGVLFKLDTAGKYSVLYTFCSLNYCGDGWFATALVRDSAGNLYGTTSGGGDYNCDEQHGCGVVFKLDTTGKYTVLHTFGGADGSYPSSIIRDGAGNLYGTTDRGGGNGYQTGVVFKLDAAGNFAVLHTFTELASGTRPNSLLRDVAGNLYGGTLQGGDPSCTDGRRLGWIQQ